MKQRRTHYLTAILGGLIIPSLTACGPRDPLKHRVTPQMANALTSDRRVIEKRLVGYITEANRKRRLARAHLEVAILRERMAEHLAAVATLRVSVLAGRARMAAHGHPISSTGQNVTVARGEAVLAKANQRFRRLNTELAKRELRYEEARYQHQRARRFEFIMESLQKVGHPSVSGRPLSPFIAQAGDRKSIMASALQDVEQLKRKTERAGRSVVGRWAPALVCPNRDVTRSQPGPAAAPKNPPASSPSSPKPSGDGAKEGGAAPRGTPTAPPPRTP